MIILGRITIILMAGLALVMGEAGRAVASETPASTVEFKVTGPVVTVYDWKTQRCEPSDVPDAAARAFRDTSGKIHLFAASDKARPFLGSSLDNLRHSCQVVYQGNRSNSLEKFDDEGWLESFFTQNGRDVIALVSMDYHPGRHKLPCLNDNAKSGRCWYSAITLAQSSDGGDTFLNSSSPGRVIVAPPMKFSMSFTRPEGAFVPSNIIHVGGSFFFLVSMSMTEGGKAGECLFRSDNIMDASSWRAWDGKSYSIHLEDPYKRHVDKAEFSSENITAQNLCEPVKSLAAAPVRTLLKLSKGGYLAVSVAAVTSNPNVPTVVAQTSQDLINWSRPVEVVSVPIYEANGGRKGRSAFYYPSLIDPNSKSPSFDSIDGSEVYLFLTRMTYGAGVDRDLVRIPLKILDRSNF